MQSVTQCLSVTYAAEPDSIGVARAAVSGFAAGAGADATQVAAVALAVSEAVTNAVRHAYPVAPGRVQVTAALARSELWILVADDGCGMQPATDRPGLGLGLGLISRVCDEVAIGPRSSGGTAVRILFKLRVAAQPASTSPQVAPVAPAPAEMAVGLPGPVAAVPIAPLPD